MTACTCDPCLTCVVSHCDGCGCCDRHTSSSQKGLVAKRAAQLAFVAKALIPNQAGRQCATIRLEMAYRYRQVNSQSVMSDCKPKCDKNVEDFSLPTALCK